MAFSLQANLQEKSQTERLRPSRKKFHRTFAFFSRKFSWKSSLEPISKRRLTPHLFVKATRWFECWIEGVLVLLRLVILFKLYGDQIWFTKGQWHYSRCVVNDKKISRLILSSLVKTLLTRRLTRALDRFDMCTNNFPPLNVRPVYLPEITSERELV